MNIYPQWQGCPGVARIIVGLPALHACGVAVHVVVSPRLALGLLPCDHRLCACVIASGNKYVCAGSGFIHTPVCHRSKDMPKASKWGVNEKAVEAKERKATAKAEGSKKSAQQAEDVFWREAGEGSKTKAQAKKEDQEKKKAEASAKKAEAKRLAEEEEAALASRPKSATKAPRVSAPKVCATCVRTQDCTPSQLVCTACLCQKCDSPAKLKGCCAVCQELCKG